jgi:hypothetical protein
VTFDLPPDRGTRAAYVLPLRWSQDDGLRELTGYLRRICPLVDLVIVDGSAPELFDVHDKAWQGLGLHVPPNPSVSARNGKVAGVITGVGLTGRELVVVADDDVRYDGVALAEVIERLADADLVVPQNYFDPLPWHAAWDTGRTLVNRALGQDFPGTLAFRRAVFVRAGGYDGDVLFENLELMRKVRAAGGRCADAGDVFVRRVPPATARFLGQRVRQAYDEFARPWRFSLFLSVVPLAGVAVRRRRWSALAAAVTGAVAVAEIGRRRDGAGAVFPPYTPVYAPVWILERGVCSWAAAAARLRGGVMYSGQRLRTAAHSQAFLSRTVTAMP